MLKTSTQEFYKTSGWKEVGKILSRDVVPTMDDQVDTKETKHSRWSKTSNIELWTLLQKKKKPPLMPTTSHRSYLICSYNINAAPVEPIWMMRIPSACYICKSEITLEEGIANQVTMACFHFALCYESLKSIIGKLELSLPVSCIGCTMHHERICTSHFGIPPSWVCREHSSRKSSLCGSITECHYWI